MIVQTGLVSIGVPAYNRPDKLAQVLEMITCQTYSNFEVIIADDASPNQTVEQVARDFARNDGRFSYIRHPQNLGVLANAQFVLGQAKGEYFTIFSDDDWHAPTFLEKLVGCLEKNPSVEMAFCDYREVYADGTPAPHYPPSHLPIFQPFTSRHRFFRILRYYWQNSAHGKQNLFYSLFRTAALQTLDFRAISVDFSLLFMDRLVVFRMLQRGSVIIYPELLCTLTVGNQKFYQTGNNHPSGSVRQRLASFWTEHELDWRQFVRNTASWLEKVGITLLFPLKLGYLLSRILLKDRS